MTRDTLPVSPGKWARTFKPVNLFQSECLRDFRTSILERGDGYFGEIVVWWLGPVTGSHGQRAQILVQTFPQKRVCQWWFNPEFCFWVPDHGFLCDCFRLSGLQAQEGVCPVWHGLRAFPHTFPKPRPTGQSCLATCFCMACELRMTFMIFKRLEKIKRRRISPDTRKS